jgi:Protein of unknown function (DUF1214)
MGFAVISHHSVNAREADRSSRGKRAGKFSQVLSGANKYTLTFRKDATPPVNGFWSITMYLVDQGWWFVPNQLNKFTVSMRDNPKFNADGSLTLCFQNETPGTDKEANWLPAPKGPFVPMLRMYYPEDTSPEADIGHFRRMRKMTKHDIVQSLGPWPHAVV